MNSYLWISLFQYFSYQHIFAKIYHNTYKADLSRATPYNPQVIDKTCYLKPDVGPCRAEFKMYYYEPSQAKCLTFSWGGCQGNGNRFDSNKECIEGCLSSPNQPKIRPKWCSLNFDYGFCFGALKRWFYDPMWKVCKERIYSGCGGNKNNFYNREQCDAVCLFASGAITAPPKRGDRVKKILVINPLNATPKRGKNQTMLTTSPKLKMVLVMLQVAVMAIFVSLPYTLFYNILTELILVRNIKALTE